VRLITIATCGAILASCTQTTDAANDPAPIADTHSGNAATPGAVLADGSDEAVSENAGAPATDSACLTQGKDTLQVAPLKALGTEPFWAARVEGRCVTYSTPEDQAGTRIWTHYTPGPDGGVWTGTFQNKPFKLTTRARPDCSDGMSDRIFPMEALLTVAGEERRGCAAPE